MIDEDKTKEQLIKEIGEFRALVKELEDNTLSDPYRARHHQIVTNIATAIAIEMGLSQKAIDNISIAGLLLDIGMIYISSNIVNKTSALNDSEHNRLRIHPQLGYDLLNKSKFNKTILKIVLMHHERHNGTGYPYGLKDNEILIEAKILGVADTIAAMTYGRPQRSAFDINEAIEELTDKSGILYNPKVVEAAIKVINSGVLNQ